MIRVLVVPLLTLALLALWLFTIVDVATSDSRVVRKLPRLVWLVLVVLTPLLGVLGWFAFGRPLAGGLAPSAQRDAGRGRMQRRVLGPDDDPAFLRSLREDPGDGGSRGLR